MNYNNIRIFFLFLLFFGVTLCYGEDDPHDKKLTGRLIYDKKEGKPKVFIEGIRLDFDFMRRNMRFVDFVNDPAVSDVHIIITRRISGSGGSVYSLMYTSNTFDFISDFTITCTTASSDTHEESRKIITDAITMGLMPFVNQTKISKDIRIRFKEKEEVEVVNSDDPWNSWTFRGDFNGSIDLEESRKNFNYSVNLRVDRVTEDWKVRNFGRMSVRANKYLDGDESYISENITNYITSSIVKSLNQRWSVGGSFSYYSSIYSNIDYSFKIQPAIEYNIFPWDVSDRKVFTLAYYIGQEWKKYHEETIYGMFEERLWQQSFRLDLQLVKTWGEVEAGLNASNYLHDFSKNRITFDTEISIRIVRGFSVNLEFRAENVHDQIYLPKGEASLEDILLNRVKLPSTFELYTGVGIRVQFGSMYNNIVNNRL
ncbi:MAG: hypothetical protein KAH68_04530 [Draconibacterium sp.]|nr:hypothetical protein [Draconibacterium sp.]